jgi:phage terminase large subunit-like protein
MPSKHSSRKSRPEVSSSAAPTGRLESRVPAEWIRNPSDDLAIQQGCWFDDAAGSYVCTFIETFCKHSKGPWAGQPLKLLEWQRDFLMRLFGWKRPDGTRRFRRAYLEVAKKNGKSTLVSAILLFLLVADGEPGAEVYVCAVDRKQASIVFDEAAAMVRQSPELAKRLDVVASRKTLVDPKNHGKAVAASADVPSQDGFNPSGVLFDELHRQKNRALWEVMEYASAARDQPLRLAITTAGDEASGPWFEQREYSEKVNAGLIADTTHLGVVYRVDPETNDLDDPATWKKANPSLGHTIKLADFARDYEEAKEVPSKLANFLRLRLNLIQGGDRKFIRPEQWAKCGSPISIADGHPVYLGLDMSSKTDLTALVAIFPGLNGEVDLRSWFWTPGDDLVARERRDGASYRAWAELGGLTVCDGSEIDYAGVKAQILAIAKQYRLMGLGADPMFCDQLLQELGEGGEGLPTLKVRQGMYSLAYPTRELERLIVTRKLRHGGDPVLAWCVSNAVVFRDAAGNIKLDKGKSGRRIDGAAAAVNALAAMSSGPKVVESPYKRRGIIVL